MQYLIPQRVAKNPHVDMQLCITYAIRTHSEIIYTKMAYFFIHSVGYDFYYRKFKIENLTLYALPMQILIKDFFFTFTRKCTQKFIFALSLY